MRRNLFFSPLWFCDVFVNWTSSLRRSMSAKVCSREVTGPHDEEQSTAFSGRKLLVSLRLFVAIFKFIKQQKLSNTSAQLNMILFSWMQERYSYMDVFVWQLHLYVKNTDVPTISIKCELVTVIMVQTFVFLPKAKEMHSCLLKQSFLLK